MRMKLIMALVDDHLSDTVLEAAREAGATGASVVTSVRGEGLEREKTFLGLDLAGQRDLLLFLVAEQRAREILVSRTRFPWTQNWFNRSVQGGPEHDRQF